MDPSAAATLTRSRSQLSLTVQTTLGPAFQVTVPRSSNVMDLKEHIASKYNVDANQQHLVFAGKELVNLHETLDSMGVADGSTLTLAPAAKSGPINFRPLLPTPAGNSAVIHSDGTEIVETPEARRLLRKVLRSMPVESREAFRDLTKPAAVAALLEQRLVLITIQPGQVTDADLASLDDPSLDSPVPPALAGPKSDSPAKDGNEGLRSKVEQLKEQMRQKKLARAANNGALVVAPAVASTATAMPASAMPSQTLDGVPSPSQPAASSAPPSLALRRGFLLGNGQAKRMRSATNAADGRRPAVARPAEPALFRRGFLLDDSVKRSRTGAGTEELRPMRRGMTLSRSEPALSSAAAEPERATSQGQPNPTALVQGLVAPPTSPTEFIRGAPLATSGPAVVNVSCKPACEHCRRRLTLSGAFDCRCGRRFCSQHRFPEDHECRFNHKAAGRQELAEANPLVAASKVTKL